MIITVFDTATGAVLRNSGVRAEDAPLQAGPGEDWIAGLVDGATHYVHPVTRAAVPLLEFACTLLPNMLSGIPAGTHAHVKGVRIIVDDGTLELTAGLGLPEDVQVMLWHPIYHPREYVVSCHA